jgi:hypothetical protein
MLGKRAVAMGDGMKWLRIMAKLALELGRF